MGEFKFNSLEDIDELISLTKQLDQKYHKYFYHQIGYQISLKFKDNVEKGKDWIKRLDTEYQYYVYKGWIERVGYSDFNYETERKIVGQIGEAFYPVYYRALGAYLGLRYGDVYTKIDKKYLPYFFEGVGKFIGNFITQSYLYEKRPDISKSIDLVDEKYRVFVCKGIGKEMALLVSNESANRFIWERLIDGMPELYKKYCLIGFKIKH